MSEQDPNRDKVPGTAESGHVKRADAVTLTTEGSGRFPIRIARDGTWYYRESPIRRKELAKLFSTVLHRDDEGRYWLKTPVERGIIQVDDAPFTVVELQAKGSGNHMTLKFRNNFDEWITADADHPIWVEQNPESGEPSPYIRVRDGLDALILRPVFYELAELAVPAEHNGRHVLGVWSEGRYFELGEQ
jgi:hypothetical protein